jgi:hypothetical protein
MIVKQPHKKIVCLGGTSSSSGISLQAKVGRFGKPNAYSN